MVQPTKGGNITFYMNSHDKKMLELLCENYDIQRSALIRKLIIEETMRLSMKEKKED